MIPIEQLTKEQAAGIRYILTDIDDTITTEGKLPACAYTAMWRLHDAGYKVIPVTGRSCGWCDLIAREWPAAAVVGENGAVVYYMGAQAKVSSIHVNAWFGDYNKLSMTKLFMETVWGETEIRDKILWFGDSPNDEPMFAYFPNSCGVANIKPFVDRIQHLPTFVAPYEGGEGFAAAIDHLLKLQPHVK